MSKKNFLFKKETSQEEILFDFLKQKVVGEKKIRFSDELLKEYIENKFVRINERICNHIKAKVHKDETVSVTIKIKDIKKIRVNITAEFQLGKEDILFEDKWLIIVQKPFGIPTHATLDPDRDHLDAALRRYLKSRDGNIAYLALHHRLDKDTSGLVLFAKNQSINKDLNTLFAEHKIKKTYIAITKYQKNTSSEWIIDNYLARSSQDRKKMISVKSGGDHAITNFKILKQNKTHMMIEASPKTGRTHQIRAHLTEYGLPILGDPLYGTENTQAERLFLHAWKLEFTHPKTKEGICVESLLPANFEKFFKNEDAP